jgi:hypothetical protein
VKHIAPKRTELIRFKSRSGRGRATLSLFIYHFCAYAIFLGHMNQPSDSSPMESKHKNGDSHCLSLSAYRKYTSFSRLRLTKISEICIICKLQIRGQIQPDRAQIRGQIQPNIRGAPRNAADTKADTPDTATFSTRELKIRSHLI